MNDFLLWFGTGFNHIVDWYAYDHILFLLVLCVPYSWKEKKHLFWLITAFTLGHSLSLALSVLGFVKIQSSIIEFLIPFTILLTALYSLFYLGSNRNEKMPVKYAFTAGFGLIHGLGFSYLLRSMLGAQASIVFPLFAFNVGIEMGQIAIVTAIILWQSGLVMAFKWSQNKVALVFSALASILALLLMIVRFPF